MVVMRETVADGMRNSFSGCGKPSFQLVSGVLSGSKHVVYFSPGDYVARS